MFPVSPWFIKNILTNDLRLLYTFKLNSIMSLPDSNSQQLQKILQTEINSSPKKRITFARYMDLVLYHQQYGYYSSGIASIGVKGDFFTSSSLGRDFGELLAIQIRQMWQNLGRPDPFYVVEMGAGNGELALDILSFFLDSGDKPICGQVLCYEVCSRSDTSATQLRANGQGGGSDCAPHTLEERRPQTTSDAEASPASQRSFIAALKYIIIEQSPALKLKQQELLESLDLDLSWKTWSEISPDSIVGCFLSNELIDAFPVHLVTKNNGRIEEVFLSIEENKLSETIHPLSTENIPRYFDSIAIDLLQPQYADGYRTEVNLQALEWLQTVASKLKRGYVLTIDYGYEANKYYRPSRQLGTLQCYYQHRRHNNPYVNIGYQDITAHVDFTALKCKGKQCDLQTIGFTQQGLFLMALGLGDRLNELSSGKYDLSQIFQRRDVLHQLIDPTGLGGFGVLIQGKNLTESEKSLRGLIAPPMF